MRKKLVSSDLVECVIGIGKNLFFNSPMDACIVICRTNKPIDRRGKVLFINARNEVTRKNSESYLEDSHIEKIARVYHQFETIEGFSSVASNDSILTNDGKLSIALYVTNAASEELQEQSFDDAIAEWMAGSADLRDSYNVLCNMLPEESK